MLVFAGILVLCFGSLAQGVPSRIIGGHDAPNHKYPYQVNLQLTGYGFICGGSILNEHWVLTAAHCVADDNMTVTAGTNFLDGNGVTYPQKFNVLHDDYKNFYHNDIALIRVDGKFEFNEFVQPIALPTEDLSDYSIPAVMSGWGLTENGPTNALQEIFLNVISNDKCKTAHREVTPKHICTFTKEGEGIYTGDSGGPLAVGGVQIGIASYVSGGAHGYPDVFTRVWSYRDWIESTMRKYQ